ncbi:MAG TPA: Lrp/AsnC family transcriptional regulator [Gammaproteobacteria bacterium]|nr:Lrp/AsnC family transcriptional regulator [Gammaproteobacteria bacterium]
MNPAQGTSPDRQDDAELDRRLVLATQAGLPLHARPWHWLATELGTTPQRVMARLAQMKADGRIRRIGVLPNHYRLGYVANGMSVWDIPDEHVDEAGRQVGTLACVSHCYRRPRHLPKWPYNLFAMVHGHSRSEVLARVADIARILGNRVRTHDVLFSTRILKKTGMRLGG